MCSHETRKRTLIVPDADVVALASHRKWRQCSASRRAFAVALTQSTYRASVKVCRCWENTRSAPDCERRSRWRLGRQFKWAATPAPADWSSTGAPFGLKLYATVGRFSSLWIITWRLELERPVLRVRPSSELGYFELRRRSPPDLQCAITIVSDIRYSTKPSQLAWKAPSSQQHRTLHEVSGFWTMNSVHHRVVKGKTCVLIVPKKTLKSALSKRIQHLIW